ncbi:hypothetical protein B0J11DRAFT_198243 [Dendryphion nanum]|uniref:Zn(2)-C6 fungal-type domain-containing protein n=1 Tax=Dendryphion nanum TaxID=256645 RepID=A0A9P9I811_9PLEO|nr:hypothetical protein B0J11DRAFT_198243 [Dendryphion nanum]
MSPRQNNSSGLPPRAKRRPHTKLRTGCAMCKQKRVKCDEARLVCKNCARWKTSCCYTPCSQQDSLSPLSNTDLSRGYKKPPSRPRNHYDSFQNPVSIPASFRDSQDSAMKSPSNESTSQSEQDLSLDLADLELLHHYYTSIVYPFGPG